MNLNSLLESPLTDLFKGVPCGTPPFPLRDVAAQGWNVLRQDLPLPLAVIKRGALEHNRRWMKAFLALTGVKLAPHGKTTMSPQLFAMQCEDGAWGMTFATMDQVRIAREFGVQRIILANQLIGAQNIRYALDEIERDPAFEFYALVDSAAGAAHLAAAASARSLPRPISLLLEMGVAGARCGARSLNDALEVAHSVKHHAPWLALRGVEGFEGSISAPTPDETTQRVKDFADLMLEVAGRCAKEGCFAPGPILLSAGGSAYYDIIARQFAAASLTVAHEVVIRSGCYLTHDSQFYRQHHERLQARSPELAALGAGLQPALEVWAYVQSRPEPTRAILTVGKRDISFDLHLPALEQWFRPGEHERPLPIPAGHAVASLNDQHAMVTVPPDSPLAVGDMISLGVSHPCTTFDRWQWLPLVDEAYHVTAGVRTFF